MNIDGRHLEQIVDRVAAMQAERDRLAGELAAFRATFPPDAAGLLRRLAFPYRGRDCDCGRCADSRAADAWAERLDALAGEEE